MKTICAETIANAKPDPDYLEIGRSPIEQKEAMQEVVEIVERCETLSELRAEYWQTVQMKGVNSLVAEGIRMEGQMLKRKLEQKEKTI